VRAVRNPGLRVLIPFVDKMHKVPMQVVTMPVPGQEGITRDNVTVRVDAVVYFRVIDPTQAVVEVQDYLFAVEQVAQTRCARSSVRANSTICCPTANS
jgi:regulator of protease activity HflC (stomatin/prohibitin superfamily)